MVGARREGVPEANGVFSSLIREGFGLRERSRDRGIAHRSKTTAGILPLNASPARTFAHPAKIRGSATTPITDLVHYFRADTYPSVRLSIGLMDTVFV
jgi:hypothetical protein